MGRRKALGLAGGAAALVALPEFALTAANRPMLTKAIPSSGEKLPVIGVGTYLTFDVGMNAEERARLTKVLDVLFAAGGRMIDSSPMYGRAEASSGALLGAMGGRRKAFIATKVWTSGREEGVAQMRRSLKRFRTDKIELMQVHNLVDWRTQLKTLREWKEKGVFKYIGITHYSSSSWRDLAAILRAEPIDFVQFPYSIVNREAAPLLDVARETKTAVITHLNFERGRLFRKVRGVRLPPWAGEFDCMSWGQFFLKFALAHPASSCVIPGTSRVKHMLDNVQAGMGRLPDARQAARMVRAIEAM
ncbi:MAG TPA: aldo/keto reductase [Alphaproteobacteria bacterium]|nr:aldo/keto reductase [Alphaproteobacteria bacterium]